jgi:hypothetical protein
MMSKFHTVSEKIAEYWNHNPSYKVISVLIQNISGSGEGCAGYDLKREVKKTYDCIDTIRTICNHSLHHYTQYVIEEIDTALLFARNTD